MMLRQIVLTRVANNKDDNRVLIETTRDTECGGEIRAGGSAAEDSFRASQQARHLERFAIGYVDNLVNVLDVNVRWHNLLTDTFNEIRSCFNNLSGFFESLENRTIRIGADDSDVRILLFQKTTSSRDRAAGAESGDEVRNLAFSLSPEFRSGDKLKAR